MMSPQEPLFPEFSLPLSRREALGVGAASLLWPCLAPASPALPALAPLPAAKTVILLWMDGGMPHLDTFDPKPRAAYAIRGPFGAIRTNAGDLQISDRLPRLVCCADDFAILRGVSHGEGGHERAAHLVLTGLLPASNETFPDFGAVLTQNRRAPAALLPQPKPPRTFAEHQSVTAYGDTAFGQACLAARQKAEAGVPFVRVALTGWDLHTAHFPRLRNDLLPALDAGLSALLTDLRQRGLLDSTLVVCMGEFGRSPRINSNRLPGRDHWPAAASVLLAGGGIRGGQTFGATDSDGTAPLEFAISSQEVLATIYHLAGILTPPAIGGTGRVLRQICR